MDFCFEVDPDLDLAIGTELCLDEAEGEFRLEDYLPSDGSPLSPTGAKPGSEEKVRMLAARYAAGVPLWHDEDCYDHGPATSLVDGEPGHDDEDEEF